jgi:transposase
MKKISTVTGKKIEKMASRKLTIGLDLGDRSSWYCVLNEAGDVVLEQVVLEQKVATTPKAVKEVFGGMPRSRMAL